MRSGSTGWFHLRLKLRLGLGRTLAFLAVSSTLGFIGAAPASAQEPAARDAKAKPTQLDVFVAGQDGYHTYRIPSLLISPRGMLLAFCEGRKDAGGDSGDIDLVLRRSRDGGDTWEPLQVIADDGPHTIGNPCPVVDRSTGTIWMLMTRNHGQDKEPQILSGTSRETRSVWVMKSVDDGLTWSPRVEITSQVKRPDWTWYATGPGISIQLESGRLLVPCDHFVAKTKVSRSHVIYSDDHGATWRIGGVAGERVNECQVAELGDHSLLINMRHHPRRNEGRAISTSTDGGLTWAPPLIDSALIEPGCQASLITLKDEQGRLSNRLLFSNPADVKRDRMTVRLSTDGGRTWPRSKLLHQGPSAYSCLVQLAGPGEAGCLYERGERNPYERITLARFKLDELTAGGSGPAK